MFVSLFGDAEIVKIVKPSSFYPSPSVDSAIIKIEVAPKADIDAVEWQKFLHHGFIQPRKMLNKRFDTKLLEKVGIDPNRRAQTVSLDEWLKLYHLFRSS
jgi:16S rRNA (adenine1518-N6/adenine1519-N6)-dimethyltransferase